MRQLVFALYLLIAWAGHGQSDTLILQDLSAAWIAVDSKGAISELAGLDIRQIVFELPQNIPSGVQLSIAASAPVAIWINGQLVKSKFTGTTVFSPDSLFSRWSDPVRVTLFGTEGISGLKTYLVRITPPQPEATQPRERRPDPFINAYLFICTILIILTGLHKRLLPYTFSRSFSNPLTFKVRSLNTEESYLGFGTMDNIFSIVYLSCLSSLLFMYLGIHPFGPVPGSALGSIIFGWLAGVMIVWLIVLAKYLFCRMISVIFEFRALANIQVQDFVHLSVLTLSLFLMLSLLDLTLFGFQSAIIQTIVRYGVTLSILFFQFWIFLKVDKFYSHRKLMIFIYLCTTEFLPAFLIIYWLIR